MKKAPGLILVGFLLLIPLLAWSGDTPPVPITKVNVHSPGPERIGNLPPVPVPVNNQQSSRKILLGKQLYFDTRLSKDNTISCATCHDPAKGWSDTGPTSTGIKSQLGGRRSPPVVNAAYIPLQFWDGRAESLEEQAKGPIQNPVEMGNTHENALKTLNSIPGYVEAFKQVFGSAPITIDQVAQAIAAFERTVVTTDSLFDRYVRGEDKALTPQEKMGLEIFNGKGHCTACHWGGNLTDGRFHNLAATQAGPLPVDKGRFDVTQDPRDLGAFKTPTVRDAALRAPYLHDGIEKTLEALLEFYNRGGGKDPNLDPLMVPLGLSREEIQALAAFIKNALTSLNPEAAQVQLIPAANLPK